jgi:hypothetical protein
MTDVSLLAAVLGPLLGIACYVAAGRMSRPRAVEVAEPPAVVSPEPVKIVVREGAPGAAGTLVLCGSPQSARRVAEALTRRSGSPLTASRTLTTAMAALRRGAPVAVCSDLRGAAKLSGSASRPATIELGAAFAEVDLAVADSELERALRYLAGSRAA